MSIQEISSVSFNPKQEADDALVVDLPKSGMLSVVVPAYDEERRLGATLKRMLAYFDGQGAPFEILVVDDGSSDGTANLVESISSCRSEVSLLSYKPIAARATLFDMACFERRGNESFSQMQTLPPLSKR